MHKITVRAQPDGSFLADNLTRRGGLPVGRGATWLEALGDYFIQNVETEGGPYAGLTRYRRVWEPAP